jgi:O-antigen ligase
MAALGAILAVSLIYSHAGVYAVTKVVQFWTFAWLGALMAGLVATSEEGPRALASAFLAAGLALGGIGMAAIFLGNAESQLAVLGGGPNTYARLMMFGVLSGVLLFSMPGHRTPRYACLAGAILLVAPLLLSGSRGGMIAALIAAAAVLAVPWCNAEVRRAKVAVLVLLVLGVAAYSLLEAMPSERLPSAVSRYNSLVSELPGGLSVAARREAVSVAWGMFLQSPVWGHGVGAFSTRDALEYPHNVFLELLSETGLLGALIFLALCLAAALSLMRLLRASEPPARAAAVWLLGMVAFIGVASQVSGDLYATRYLFVFLGMVGGVSGSLRGFRGRELASDRTVAR